MEVSALDMFTIGVGPSSSHTVGPMRAAQSFVTRLADKNLLNQVQRLQIILYGSLALTGKGHSTDRAMLLGLMGELPEKVDPESMEAKVEGVRTSRRLAILGQREIDFFESTDLLFEGHRRLPLHSNGIEISAMDSFGRLLDHEIYYSVGGGFVLSQAQMQDPQPGSEPGRVVAYPFSTMEDIKRHCANHQKTLLELILANEASWRSLEESNQKADDIYRAMRHCAARGVAISGILPGGLNVKRRASELWNHLNAHRGQLGPSESIEWLSVYALAVNEENAAGSRVVTAPTNGAAGVIPSVLHYLIDHDPPASKLFTDEAALARHFLLVAGAMGVLYKTGASISAAEMGCQGEIGVASSMAAAAYCSCMGGTLLQVEAAAEIAMEHHLGLTCDPVGGLVQIPCIERNTMGAVKALTAARLALRGDGIQKVSLDQVIRTMLHTGKDMSVVYKETSLGGLAVNVIEC